MNSGSAAEGGNLYVIQPREYRASYAERQETAGIASCVGIALVAEADPRLHGIAHVYVQDITAGRTQQIVDSFLDQYESVANAKNINPRGVAMLFGGNFERLQSAGLRDQRVYTSLTSKALDSVVAKKLDRRGYPSVPFPWQRAAGRPFIMDEMRILLEETGRFHFIAEGQEFLEEAFRPGSCILDADEYLATFRR